jgi:hypothetical protein
MLKGSRQWKAEAFSKVYATYELGSGNNSAADAAAFFVRLAAITFRRDPLGERE